MRIKIDGKNPPTFTLSGSGNLVFLYLAEVQDKKPLSPEDPEMWKIQPNGNDKISELPSIIYGTVPNGFTQVTPTSGAPPPLMEGKVYAFGGPAYNANGGSIWFTIKDGKSVLVPKPENYP
jgi:hypothetical protein